MLAKKKVLIGSQSQPDATDLIDDAAHQSMVHTKSLKALHHAVDAEDMQPQRRAFNRTAQASQSWAARTERKEAPAVPPRSGEFTEQLKQDRAQLDETLGLNR